MGFTDNNRRYRDDTMKIKDGFTNQRRTEDWRHQTTIINPTPKPTTLYNGVEYRVEDGGCIILESWWCLWGEDIVTSFDTTFSQSMI